MKMIDLNIRECPICGGFGTDVTFPYGANYNETHFSYIKCNDCKSVYVSPIPDLDTFSLMYKKTNYHNIHYSECDQREYKNSVDTLKLFISGERKLVLDYGCGVGLFLKLLSDNGFDAKGVEFDQSAAYQAAKYANCEVFTIDEFGLSDCNKYDCIHFGDVLEHLPDPYTTVFENLKKLNPGGVLFVEGPLEVNPSIVYYSALFFAFINRIFNKDKIPSYPPTHLFRVDAKQQLNFFNRYENLELVYWEVYETGFPYSYGGFIKKNIAKISKLISGKKVFSLVFGNRFRAIFIKKG